MIFIIIACFVAAVLAYLYIQGHKVNKTSSASSAARPEGQNTAQAKAQASVPYQKASDGKSQTVPGQGKHEEKTFDKK
jgi:hypothetical protein